MIHHHTGISEDNGWALLIEGRYTDMLDLAKYLESKGLRVSIDILTGQVWVEAYRLGTAKALAKAHIEKRAAEWAAYAENI